MKIILKKDAKLLGINRYFTGKLCKYGHISERRVSSGHCIECEVSDRVKAYKKSYKKIYHQTDAYKEYQKEYQKTDACKEYRKEYKKEYRKTDACKESQKESVKKSNLKYPNARKSRLYFGRNKHKINTYDNCEKCHSTNRVEAHHHDYDIPLGVTFLCKDCHVDWHKNNIPLNKVNGIFTE